MTNPAHPHATWVAVYPALFKKIFSFMVAVVAVVRVVVIVVVCVVVIYVVCCRH